MLYIYAGNHAQANAAANALYLVRNRWTFLTRSTIHGMPPHSHVLKFGTWFEVRDRDYIDHYLRANESHVMRLEDR